MSTHSIRSHLLFSASQAHRLLNCNGPIFLKDKLPEQEKTEASKEGEEFHETMEIVLHDFLEHKVKGTDPDIRAHLLTKNSELLKMAYDAREVVWEKGLEKFITGKAYGFEELFVLDNDLGIGGIGDFWAIYKDRRGEALGYTLDYKSGFKFVSEKNNAQLATLAVSMRAEIRRNGKDLSYVRAAIYQPRAEGEAYRETKFTSSQLDTWEKKLRKQAELTFIKKKVKFKAGDWCSYCPALSICEHRKKDLEEKSLIKLTVKSSLPDVKILSDEQREKILLNREDIIEFVKSVYSHELNLQKNGKGLKSFKVVSSHARRKWKEEIEEIGKNLELHGIKSPVTYEPSLITITEAEKELTKLKNKNEAKSILSELTTLAVNSEVLVLDSDPRPAIQNNLELLK